MGCPKHPNHPSGDTSSCGQCEADFYDYHERLESALVRAHDALRAAMNTWGTTDAENALSVNRVDGFDPAWEDGIKQRDAERQAKLNRYGDPGDDG
jgi:hypothetical protein